MTEGAGEPKAQDKKSIIIANPSVVIASFFAAFDAIDFDEHVVKWRNFFLHFTERWRTFKEWAFAHVPIAISKDFHNIIFFVLIASGLILRASYLAVDQLRPNSTRISKTYSALYIFGVYLMVSVIVGLIIVAAMVTLAAIASRTLLSDPAAGPALCAFFLLAFIFVAAAATGGYAIDYLFSWSGTETPNESKLLRVSDTRAVGKAILSAAFWFLLWGAVIIAVGSRLFVSPKAG